MIAKERKRLQRVRDKKKYRNIELKLPVDLFNVISFDAKTKSITKNNLIVDCLLEFYPQDSEN
jgi:hypothetical protein